MQMSNLILSSTLLIIISLGLMVGCNNNGGGSQNPIVVSPNVPSDIPGGASNADLRQAAMFAWQEFIALNWPALAGTRDTPDDSELFGDPPGFFDDASQDFGYNSVPPKYVYGDGEVEPCEGQTPVAEAAWINADEISQIGLDDMFAGVAPTESDVNSEPQLIRFLAKANVKEYVYAVDPVLSLWNHTSKPSDEPFWDMVDNFTVVFNGNGNPSKLPGPVIDFPDGTIEAKGSFRELTKSEKESGRFYQTTVRYYEQDESDPDSPCYREAVWGFISMHIIHKTPSAPYFIYTTIEQADALLTPDGKPVEDENGTIINQPDTASTTPPLSYIDGDPPILTIVGDSFCEETGDRLYYQEIALNGGLPFGGNICQNFRDFQIPETIIEVNREAHEAIERYNLENGLETSVWLNYKITNVQWLPFDLSEIDFSNPNSDRNESTFYLSDIAIETDYNLSNFSGRTYGRSPPDPNDNPAFAGPPTDIPANFNNFDPSRQTYQNTLVFDDEGNLEKTYNMGGCMGCHGVAQAIGTDFSFILRGGERVNGSEAPAVTDPGTSNPLP